MYARYDLFTALGFTAKIGHIETDFPIGSTARRKSSSTFYSSQLVILKLLQRCINNPPVWDTNYNLNETHSERGSGFGILTFGACQDFLLNLNEKLSSYVRSFI